MAETLRSLTTSSDSPNSPPSQAATVLNLARPSNGMHSWLAVVFKVITTGVHSVETCGEMW